MLEVYWRREGGGTRVRWVPSQGRAAGSLFDVVLGRVSHSQPLGGQNTAVESMAGRILRGHWPSAGPRTEYRLGSDDT